MRGWSGRGLWLSSSRERSDPDVPVFQSSVKSVISTATLIMAESDIQIFRDELPDAFDDKTPPTRWDEYHIVPVDIEGGRGKARDYNPIEQVLVDHLKEESKHAYQQGDTLNRIDRPDPSNAFSDYTGSTGLRVDTVFPGGQCSMSRLVFRHPTRLHSISVSLLPSSALGASI